MASYWNLDGIKSSGMHSIIREMLGWVDVLPIAGHTYTIKLEEGWKAFLMADEVNIRMNQYLKGKFFCRDTSYTLNG